ncbi:AraC family transcriptional regulator ligand-binding domain-containing protein [Amycolatopsis dendrobii]|uniref:AraC family transcriptional regulator ligand-binding domain-containing protein n=1 Tax=Amycolatopsis dendrobii TaxID=2760662 RepID=A0A7W3VX47_9PSEU|nr:AraC family transcriptional regulator ligand-binding domain-containing protein [Amycolatopsis dendrobii]MBB1154307.1 AraC family transcriptional regulator ligand-binding domain-containing protein [Amycolatopsis dendrobii]
MDDPAVLDALAQRLARIGERRNLDVPALLHRLGIRPDRTGVTRRQVSELTRELWLRTDDGLFALGPRAPRGLFRLVVRSVAPSPDLRTALHRLEEAAEVLPGMPAVAVRTTDPLVEVENRRPSARRPASPCANCCCRGRNQTTRRTTRRSSAATRNSTRTR